MMKKTISDAVSNISTRHIEEAADYSAKGKAHKPVWIKLGTAAACLALALIVVGTLVPFHGDVVSVYAYETNEEITAAGVVMDTGTIRNSGEMTGHPLMFYLSGKDIETVRFSCKNQQLSFMDWTEKRDEYGNAQNFTVTYGEDESEYYYLTIDWVPNTTIRELTDHTEVSIEDLPAEMREDIIVMEITFANGKTATKAITISLLDNGTFFAAFDDYKIDENDDFIKRPDSVAISRDILYSQDDSPIREEEQGDSIRMVMVNGELYLDTGQESTVTIRCGMLDGQITSTVSGTERPTENNQSNFGTGFGYQYGSQEGMIEINMNDKWWVFATEKVLASSQLMTEPVEYLPSEDVNLDAIKEIVQAYYSDTVFEVVSIEVRSQAVDEIVFSVCVSKDGVVQDPDRTISLRPVNGVWEVVNEGY